MTKNSFKNNLLSKHAVLGGSVCLVVLVAIGITLAALAQTEKPGLRFRVDNSVTVSEKTTKSSTVFYDGNVYNFIEPNGEISIYNKSQGTYTLLDPSCRLQTEILVAQAEKDVAKLLETYSQSSDYFQLYLAKPTFEESSYEPESGLMTFRSPWVEYRFDTEVFQDKDIATAYFDYVKQLTIVNIRTTKSPSLLTRLVINPLLEEKKCFPTKVGITIYPKGKVIVALESIKAETTHTLVNRLQHAEETKINQVKHYIEVFRKVSLQEYLHEIGAM